MRLLILFGLLTFSSLVNAQTDDAAAYLPPPDRVLRDYQGTSELDTASRRYAALTLLLKATAVFSGTQAFRDMPPAFAAKNRAYLKAQAKIQGPMERRFAADNCKGENCDRYRFYTAAWHYENSSAFQKELAERYFPPSLQSKFLNAKRQPASSAPMPQSDIRELMRRWNITPAQTRAAFAIAVTIAGTGLLVLWVIWLLKKRGGWRGVFRRRKYFYSIAAVLVLLAIVLIYPPILKLILSTSASGWVSFLIVLGILYLLYRFLRWAISYSIYLYQEWASNKERQEQGQLAYQEFLRNDHPEVRNQVLLRRFGANANERTKNIDAIFDRKTDDIDHYFSLIPDFFRAPSATTRICRSLAAMHVREREALRIVYHLFNMGMVNDAAFEHLHLCLTYGNGQGALRDTNFQLGDRPPEEPVSDPLTGKPTPSVDPMTGKPALPVVPVIVDTADMKINQDQWNQLGMNGLLHEYLTRVSHLANTDAAVSTILSMLTKAIKMKPNNPVLKTLAAKLTGGGKLSDLPSPPSAAGPYALLLGTEEDTGNKRFYEGEGSLITIARPGAGKTRCHVIPNLLTWPGAAVVLDIKGELYASTSRWRQKNVGPVYKFSPLDPNGTHSYNPLAGVRSDIDYLWEDSRFLAEMMIVPSGAKDPFWDNKARDILTAAVALVCSSDDPARRTLSKVLDIIHGVNWKDFIAGLRERTDLDPMYRAGYSLDEELEPKVRSNVLQTAQASLSAWEGPRVAAATRTSDWQPLDLRNGTNPTVYICVRPNEINSLLSALRVLIAQHIRAFLSTNPVRDAAPILFVLDELPSLRHMQPVEEGLQIGRQYGIKLWLFSQTLGQLQNAYENADGMIGSCAVRLFMNPSTADGTAQKLSDEIGYQESILDATRQKIVEPQVLAGPEYEDFVLVLEANKKPYRLRKHPIDKDAELKSRMGSL